MASAFSIPPSCLGHPRQAGIATRRSRNQSRAMAILPMNITGMMPVPRRVGRVRRRNQTRRVGAGLAQPRARHGVPQQTGRAAGQWSRLRCHVTRDYSSSVRKWTWLDASPATMRRPSGPTAQQSSEAPAVKAATTFPVSRSHTFRVLTTPSINLRAPPRALHPTIHSLPKADAFPHLQPPRPSTG